MKKFLFTLALLLPILTKAEGIDIKIDKAFQPISDFFSQLIFFPVFGIPFVLILLVFSAVFFTIYFGFPNIRYLKTAINVVRGKYDHIDSHTSANKELEIDGDIKDTIKDESKEGEVSHFQALATAVSGTVGNGTDVMSSTVGKIQIGKNTSDSTTVVGELNIQDPTKDSHAASRAYVDAVGALAAVLDTRLPRDGKNNRVSLNVAQIHNQNAVALSWVGTLNRNGRLLDYSFGVASSNAQTMAKLSLGLSF